MGLLRSGGRLETLAVSLTVAELSSYVRKLRPRRIETFTRQQTVLWNKWEVLQVLVDRLSALLRLFTLPRAFAREWKSNQSLTKVPFGPLPIFVGDRSRSQVQTLLHAYNKCSQGKGQNMRYTDNKINVREQRGGDTRRRQQSKFGPTRVLQLS